MPCRARVVAGHERSSFEYQYAGGRLVAVRRDGASKFDLFCRVEPGRIACGSDDGPRSAKLDDRGKIIELEFLGRAWRVSYNDGGGVDAITQLAADPESRRSSFSYDDAGRLVEDDYVSPETEIAGTYIYDEHGRVARETDGEDPVIFHYDRAGSLASVVTGGDRVTTTYDYDRRGRVVRAVTVERRPDRRTERTYDYDCAKP